MGVAKPTDREIFAPASKDVVVAVVVVDVVVVVVVVAGWCEKFFFRSEVKL